MTFKSLKSIFLNYLLLAVFLLVRLSYCKDCEGDKESQSPSKPQITLRAPIKFRAPNNSISLPSYQATGEVESLSCDFHKPVEWAYTFTNLTNYKTVDNHVARSRTAETPRKYAFLADLSLLYVTSSKNADLILVCQTASRENTCERSYAEFNSKRPVKFTNPDTPSAIFKNIVEILWNGPEKEEKEECGATLVVKKMADNVILYTWVRKSISNEVRRTKSKAYTHFLDFWNSYREHETGRRCTKFLDKYQECSNCKTIKYAEIGAGFINNITSNGIVFYAEVDGRPLVQKGIFSLYRGNNLLERVFTMDPDIALEDQVYLDLENVPGLVMYTEMEYTITCWVSTFYFAIGTIITTLSNPDLEPNGTVEIFTEHGSRMVSRSFVFSSEYGNSTQILICFAPMQRSTEWVNNSKTVFIEMSSAPELIGSPTIDIQTEENMKNVSASCTFRGKPTPDISWELPKLELNEFVSEEMLEHESSSHLIFPRMKQMYVGVYKCTGSNFKGNVTRTIKIFYPPNELSMTLKLSLGISIGAAMLIFLAVILLLIRRLRLEKELFRLQTVELMNEFREGSSLYTKDVFDEHFCVLKQPYNTEYEVPRDRWSIGNRVLGSGEFGVVRQGTVQIENSEIKVAIKTTKTRPDVAGFKGFLDELKIMAYVGVHDNIVSLVAAFSEDNNARNVLIGVEFCDNGSLLEYIISRRDTFINMVTPNGDLTSDFNLKAIEVANSEISGHSNMSTIDLYKWSYQIANGMAYLETKRVLHADLATRNVLLSAKNEAKIGDFGLSRIMQNSENYTKKTRCPLPWKWMAIESLKEMKFSSDSDMWSYGVTLWEIFSLCAGPWDAEGKYWSLEFIEELECGLRLSRPFGATKNTYNLVMVRSWHPQPNLRIRFSEAKEFFQNALTGYFKNA